MTREENRRKFSAGAELKDMFLRAGIDSHVFHAANFETGEEIGTEPDEYCRRFGGVPCTYWPNGASINQRFSTTRNSAKEAV